MKIYLAGVYSRPYCLKESMKIYLAGNAPWKEDQIYNKLIIDNKPNILESYYYTRNGSGWIDELKQYFNDFMLDSGAFTFMNNLKTEIDWNLYVEQYADFINKYNIDKFIELDIDIVVGLKEVEKLRNKLEKLTNKKCIPVWHRTRGKDYWNRITKEYNYVAIGGFAIKTIRQNDYKYISWFLDIAKQNKCKVHGLGFTNLEGLKKYKFYSVDSTAWIYGNRAGFIYIFNGNTMIKKKVDGKRLKGKEAAIHNFSEWIKFQKYAEKNL